jgi:hypothetical protein
MILSKGKLYYAKFHCLSQTDDVSREMYFYVDELKYVGGDLKAVCNDSFFVIKGNKGISFWRENAEIFADTDKWENLEEIKEVPNDVYRLDCFLLV